MENHPWDTAHLGRVSKCHTMQSHNRLSTGTGGFFWNKLVQEKSSALRIKILHILQCRLGVVNVLAVASIKQASGIPCSKAYGPRPIVRIPDVFV